MGKQYSQKLNHKRKLVLIMHQKSLKNIGNRLKLALEWLKHSTGSLEFQIMQLRRKGLKIQCCWMQLLKKGKNKLKKKKRKKKLEEDVVELEIWTMMLKNKSSKKNSVQWVP